MQLENHFIQNHYKGTLGFQNKHSSWGLGIGHKSTRYSSEVPSKCILQS